MHSRPRRTNEMMRHTCKCDGTDDIIMIIMLSGYIYIVTKFKRLQYIEQEMSKRKGVENDKEDVSS